MTQLTSYKSLKPLLNWSNPWPKNLSCCWASHDWPVGGTALLVPPERFSQYVTAITIKAKIKKSQGSVRLTLSINERLFKECQAWGFLLSPAAFPQWLSLINKMWNSLCPSFQDSCLFLILGFPPFFYSMLMCLCLHPLPCGSLWFGGTMEQFAVWFWSSPDESTGRRGVILNSPLLSGFLQCFLSSGNSFL